MCCKRIKVPTSTSWLAAVDPPRRLILIKEYEYDRCDRALSIKDRSIGRTLLAALEVYSMSAPSCSSLGNPVYQSESADHRKHNKTSSQFTGVNSLDRSLPYRKRSTYSRIGYTGTGLPSPVTNGTAASGSAVRPHAGRPLVSAQYEVQS